MLRVCLRLIIDSSKTKSHQQNQGFNCCLFDHYLRHVPSVINRHSLIKNCKRCPLFDLYCLVVMIVIIWGSHKWQHFTRVLWMIYVNVVVFVNVTVYAFVFLLVRSCLLTTLITCLKGHKSLRVLYGSVFQQCLVGSESVSDEVTYRAVWGQLKKVIWHPSYWSLKIIFKISIFLRH